MLLLQVALTAATDTSELLGSFEQAEPARAHTAMQRRLTAAALAAAAGAAGAGHFEPAAAATASWRAYDALAASPQCNAATLDASFQAACSAAADAAAAAGAECAASWAATAAACAAFSPAEPLAAASGGFEWVDGILLDAMAAGDWVLLDNANLCSPTVLDRLNPLLEPGGELLIPEAGLVGGVPRCAFPAPGFRLLLALDPRHGEVSRAMRNRGIEVFMLPTGAAPDAKVRTLRLPTQLPFPNPCKAFHP